MLGRLLVVVAGPAGEVTREHEKRCMVGDRVGKDTHLSTRNGHIV